MRYGGKLLWLLLVLFFAAPALPVQAAEPDIGASSAIVIEASTGRVVYEKNADRREYPASLTKMMTCILALENGREIRTPPFPGLCSYVRVVQFGYELAFWTADEFTDDAAGVLGALIGAAKGLATPQPTTGA